MKISGFALGSSLIPALFLAFGVLAEGVSGPRLLAWDVAHPRFGGLSALVVQGGGAHVIAGSDRGGFFSAPMRRDDTGRLSGLGPARYVPLTSHKGETDPEPFHSDIEALAPLGRGFAIAFESYSRVQRLPTLEAPAQALHGWNRFEDLFGNTAFEALAVLPGGLWLAFVEGQGRDKTGLAYGWDGTRFTPYRVPVSAGYDVTGADMGPDGCLYLLERRYSIFSGFRYRLRRLWQDAPRWNPELGWNRDELLYDSPANRDMNAEGLSAWGDAAGRLHLTLVTDNGFTRDVPNWLIEFGVKTACQQDRG